MVVAPLRAELGKLARALESQGVVRLRDYTRAVGEELPPQNLRDLIDDLKGLLPPRPGE